MRVCLPLLEVAANSRLIARHFVCLSAHWPRRSCFGGNSVHLCHVFALLLLLLRSEGGLHTCGPQRHRVSEHTQESSSPLNKPLYFRACTPPHKLCLYHCTTSIQKHASSSAGVAQRLERQSHNLKVVRSNLTIRIFFTPSFERANAHAMPLFRQAETRRACIGFSEAYKARRGDAMKCLRLLVFAASVFGSIEYSPMEGSTDMDETSDENENQ